jgi:hypothetical protein
MADKKPQRFTIDADKEGAEVPTLTKLLYSRNVVKTQGSPGSGRQGKGLDAGRTQQQNLSSMMTLEPTLTVERPQPGYEAPVAPPSAEIAAEFVVSQLASNRVQPLNMGAARGGSTDRRVMPAATPFAMANVIRPTAPSKFPTNTAAGAGIRAVSEKAKIEASLVFIDAGEAFTIQSIVTTSMERITLWSGMEISKAVFTDLLGRLTKFGFAEFSTLGATGNGNFDRTTCRSAFQAKNAEWVTLVRVKSANDKDSIVALFSSASIQMHLPAFHSAGMPTAKAA